MDSTHTTSPKRLLVAGLVALVALLAAIGVSGLGSANAAGTSGSSTPSFAPVQSATPGEPPADERPDGRDCPEGAGSGDGDGSQQERESPAPGTTPDAGTSL